MFFIAVKYINIPIDISQLRGIFNSHSHTLNLKVQILQEMLGRCKRFGPLIGTVIFHLDSIHLSIYRRI